MSFDIRTTPIFERQLKKMVKKHADLKQVIAMLRDSLRENPKIGIPLGKDCFKIRVAIPSKNRGKSGGARVITHVRVIGEKVFLLSIYDKSTQEAFADTTLDEWIEHLPE
jgi:hypothetical protein